MTKSVVRGWMPAIFGVGLCLVLVGMSPIYWLLASPLFIILFFMVGLAEVHDEGQKLIIDRFWSVGHIPKEDVLATNESFLDGIGVLRLRWFVFPFGRVYFVYEWSANEAEHASKRDLLASAALATVSGFIAARAALAVHVHGFGFETSHARVLAIAIVAALCAVFAILRTKKTGLANCFLFVAAYIFGLVRW